MHKKKRAHFACTPALPLHSVTNPAQHCFLWTQSRWPLDLCLFFYFFSQEARYAGPTGPNYSSEKQPTDDQMAHVGHSLVRDIFVAHAQQLVAHAHDPGPVRRPSRHQLLYHDALHAALLPQHQPHARLLCHPHSGDRPSAARPRDRSELHTACLPCRPRTHAPRAALCCVSSSLRHTVRTHTHTHARKQAARGRTTPGNVCGEARQSLAAAGHAAHARSHRLARGSGWSHTGDGVHSPSF
jgi:hypothetical protein